MNKNDELDTQIKGGAFPLAESQNEVLEALSKKYWEASSELSKSNFSSRWDQMRAIRKLSQLGLALHSAGEAYSAINIARCI